MFQERARTYQGLLLFLDTLCIGFAFGVAVVLRIFHDSIPVVRIVPSTPWATESLARSDYAVLLIANLFAWLFYLRRSKLYLCGDLDRVARVLPVYVRALLLSIFASGTVVFVLKMSVSRLLFGYFYIAMFGFLLGKQMLVVALQRRIQSSDSHRRHALVIGAEQPGCWFANVVASAGNSGYHLVGLLLNNGQAELSQAHGVPVLGTVDDVDKVLRDHPVDEVFVVGSAREICELAPVAQDLIEKGRIVSLISTLSGGSNGVRGRVTDFNGIPMISFGPMPKDELHSGMKRAIDVTASVAALVLLSPVMLGVALLIKLFDPGPVLFRQERLGLGGNKFRIYKFRSMRIDAERLLRSDARLYRRYVENGYKLPEKEDPRISRLGSFLRRSSLDELPQIWNVLKGDMTLVGPRPIVPAEIENYEPYADLFLSVRPGLTGYWQVSGRSHVSYPERAFMDLDYVGGCTVAEDLAIIARTVPAVLRRKGAH